MKKTAKKLALHRDTLRSLLPAELEEAAGGAATRWGTCYNSCAGCTIGCPSRQANCTVIC